jgi:long-chain acyl-CoA synthetase
VGEADAHLAPPEQVRRFRVLGRERTADWGELTPGLKPRRQLITVRYAPDIDDLYSRWDARS